MNSICSHMEQQMVDVLDGTVSLSDRMAFFDHLSQCEACRNRYKQELAFRNALRMAVPETNVDVTAAVMAKIAPRKKQAKWQKWIPSVAAAACLVLTFTAFRLGNAMAPSYDTLEKGAGINYTAEYDLMTADSNTDAIKEMSMEVTSASAPRTYKNQVEAAPRMFSAAAPESRKNTLLIDVVNEVLTRYESNSLSYYMNIRISAQNPEALYSELCSRFEPVLESDGILVFEATAQESVLTEYFSAFGENLLQMDINRLTRTGEDALLFVVLNPPY